MKTFKRSVAVLLSVLMVLSVLTVATISASADTTELIYLVPNSEWTQDDARFATYFFNNDGGEAWESMEDTNGDGTYEAIIPEGDWTGVIFGRMNPATTENHWDNKWNQTNDLAFDGTNNCYTLNAGSWDGAGSWSTIVVETPTESVPTPTLPQSGPVEDGKVIINTTTNGTAVDTSKYDTAKIDTITVKFMLQSKIKLVNCQGVVNYDSNALEFVSFKMPSVAGSVTNSDLFNMIKFNASNVQQLYDFTTAKEFCIVTFKPKADCNTTVSLDFEELNATELTGTESKDSPLVTNGTVVGEFSISTDIAIAEIPTETKPTQKPTPKPTQPATKKPSIKVAKNKLNAGQKTTVTVKNAGNKKVTYKSANTKVATVSAKGVVTALGKGTAKITATIKGYGKLTCKITVKTSPKLYNGKKAVKNKTYTIKKGKKLTLTIKGKAPAVKNSYTSSKKKIAKVTSGAKATKIKIKGYKKGTAKITVKVNKYYKTTFKVKVK